MPTPYLIEGIRVGIRRVVAADQAAFTAATHASADLHHPWMAAPATDEEFDSYLASCDGRTKEGLLVCARETGDLAGFININNIVGGRFQCGSLGYAAFVPYAGRGVLGEGLALVLRFAFEDLGLHRLEANIQPGNEPSLNLVRRHGFRLEGYSPDMLFIDGAWRDHERWAITSDMPRAAVPEQVSADRPAR